MNKCLVVFLFKRAEDQGVWINFRTITVLSHPGKVCAGVLEKRVRPIVETQIQEEKWSFIPGCGMLNQLYILSRVMDGSWELYSTKTLTLTRTFMDKMSRCSLGREEFLFGGVRISSLLLAGDVVLLVSSRSSGFTGANWVWSAGQSLIHVCLSLLSPMVINCG